LFKVNLNLKFFGSVGATYNVSNQEARTELEYLFLNDFYKQGALTEQKEKLQKMGTHGSSCTAGNSIH
jgi:hypothetical protein